MWQSGSMLLALASKEAASTDLTQSTESNILNPDSRGLEEPTTMAPMAEGSTLAGGKPAQ